MNWQEIHRLDQDATLWINSFYSDFSDVVWSLFSNKLIWIPLYLLIVYFVIRRLGWKRGGIVVAGALLTFAFCDQFSGYIKDLTERLRPLRDSYMMEHALHVLEGGGKYGFFSAHAANVFGLATSTYIGLRLDGRMRYTFYAVGMYIWAALVSVSRIFVGKHYLGDVLVGIVVGLLAGCAFAWIARMVIKRYQIA